MGGPSGCRGTIREIARVCVLLLAGACFPARAVRAGDALAPDVQRQGQMMTLSIRIAQAEGHEAKIRKYKSFARQQRSRERSRANLVPIPGTRALRPGRTP